jgi:signal transduction histidine kinase
MADNVYVPARVRLDQVSVDEVKLSLQKSLGDSADSEVDSALDELGLNASERRPAALRQLRDQLSASLNLRFGVLAAHRVMQQTLPFRPSIEKQPDDIYLIESMLAIHGGRLTGLASELNKLRVHHREVLDNLPIGLIAIAPSGEVLKWNAAIADYTQIDKEVAIGSAIDELAQPWQSFIDDFLAADTPVQDSVKLLVGGQARWFNIQRSVDKNQPELGADRVLLIEEQTKSMMLMQSYMDNERLASIGRLAAGVAHEIGNPLTGIACIAQNLRYQREQTPIGKSATQILSQTDRIDRIVKSLINFSRGDSAQCESLETVQLRKIIDEAIDLLSLSDSQRRVDFICTVDPLLNVQSNAQQLIQVFLNLFGNALDASPDNASVTIAAESLGDTVEVAISDRGAGIDENIQHRVFEPFVTSKEPGEGTGLGLWVVFNLMTDLGGSVSLTSPARNSDRGSTAVMRLPCK